LNLYLHSPLECSNYALFNPLPFSHLRYFRIKINQIRYRYKNSSPYISGDSIASLTDYIAYGRFQNKKLNLAKLSRAKSIFVYGDLLDKFLTESKGYVNAHTLVTGNSDKNFTKPILLPKSIKLWLCQNNAIPKQRGLYTLPIGIENLRLGRAGLTNYFKKYGEDAVHDKVLVPPMGPTNLVRAKVIFEALQKPKYFVVEKKLLCERDYFHLTRKYRFVFCCEGNGFENHRIWETLYQGSFPVLLETNWSKSLKYLNLPILYVSSLASINLELLEKFYETHKNFDPSTTESLWTPYWRKLIALEE
jgi:hypothetical protein